MEADELFVGIAISPTGAGEQDGFAGRRWVTTTKLNTSGGGEVPVSEPTSSPNARPRA